MKKNFLFIGHYSGAVFDFDSRNFNFAKELLIRGYNVTVVNAAYSHRVSEPKVIDVSYEVKFIEGIRFISIKTPPYKGNGFKRILNMLAFSWGVFINGNDILKFSGVPDYVFTSYPHPFQMLPSLWFRLKHNATLIMDLRDLWPDSIIQLTNASKYNPVILLMRGIEWLSIKYSDKIVSPLSGLAVYLETRNNKFNSSEKFLFLSQMFIPIKVTEREFHETLSSRLRLNNYNFNIGYVGSVTDSNAVNILLEASKNFPQTGFHIIGSGNLYPSIKEKYDKASNVHFYGPFKKNEAICSMSFFDALYRGEPDIQLYQYGIAPLKLFEYMSSGRPIIQSSNSINNVVDQVGCGLTSRSGDVESLIKNIEILTSLGKNELDEMGSSGKKYVLSHCAPETVVHKLIDFLN